MRLISLCRTAVNILDPFRHPTRLDLQRNPHLSKDIGLSEDPRHQTAREFWRGPLF